MLEVGWWGWGSLRDLSCIIFLMISVAFHRLYKISVAIDVVKTSQASTFIDHGRSSAMF